MKYLAVQRGQGVLQSDPSDSERVEEPNLFVGTKNATRCLLLRPFEGIGKAPSFYRIFVRLIPIILWFGSTNPLVASERCELALGIHSQKSKEVQGDNNKRASVSSMSGQDGPSNLSPIIDELVELILRGQYQTADASSWQTVSVPTLISGKRAELEKTLGKAAAQQVFNEVRIRVMKRIADANNLNGQQRRAHPDKGANTETWKVRTLSLVQDLVDTGFVYSANFSPDRSKVVTAQYNNQVNLWDAKTGELLRTFEGHLNRGSTVVFSPEGLQVLTASNDGTAGLWNAQTGELIQFLRGHTEAVGSALFSRDGSRVVTASLDKTARIWNAKTGDLIMILIGHTKSILSASFSPDQSKVLTVSQDETAKVWDAQTGSPLFTINQHEDLINSGKFSPDGSQILTASKDGMAFLFDAETGDVLQTFNGNGGSVWSAVFSPDGTKVLTASDDKIARIWDVKTGALLKKLDGHKRPVTLALFSLDGRQVLTNSHDSTTKLWDSESGRELHTFKGNIDWRNSTAFSQDGTHVLIGTEQGSLNIWSLYSDLALGDEGRDVPSLGGGAP